MLNLKNGGKSQPESKSKSRAKPRPSKPLPLAQVLKGLSFSFYGEETIRKQKQVILDPYEFLDQLPVITPVPKQTGRKKRSSGNAEQRKEQGLIIDGLLFEGKCDEIDLVTTNDSRIEYKPMGKGAKGRKSSMSRRESVGGQSDRQRCRSVCSQSKQSGKGKKK